MKKISVTDLSIEKMSTCSFTVTNDGTDDGDAVYEGDLTITFVDGNTITTHIHWVREGDRQDMENGDLKAMLNYFNSCGIRELTVS